MATLALSCGKIPPIAKLSDTFYSFQWDLSVRALRAILLLRKALFQRRVYAALSLAAAFVLSAASFSCSASRENLHPMLPIGYVDAPQNGAAVKGALAASGWALSEDGVADIEVYIDRAFVTSTTPNTPRPDVLEKNPLFRSDPNPGWNASIDLGHITPGAHEFTVQVRSRKGAVRDICSFLVNVSR
jgi:hypothetical protein